MLNEGKNNDEFANLDRTKLRTQLHQEKEEAIEPYYFLKYANRFTFTTTTIIKRQSWRMGPR